MTAVTFTLAASPYYDFVAHYVVIIGLVYIMISNALLSHLVTVCMERLVHHAVYILYNYAGLVSYPFYAIPLYPF